jgi:hypothetical protein
MFEQESRNEAERAFVTVDRGAHLLRIYTPSSPDAGHSNEFL